MQNLNSQNYPERIKAMNFIRIGNVFKTTCENRFPLSLNFLLSLSREFANIHDIGSSNGSASIALIDKLKYRKYFCLDKYPYAFVNKLGNKNFLSTNDGEIHMIESPKFLIFLDPYGQNKNLFEMFISAIFKNYALNDLDRSEVRFIDPRLKNNKKVEFQEFDLFSSDLNQKSDLIIIFNLLNKFNNSKFAKNIGVFLSSNLKKNGIAVIGENETMERASFYMMNNDLALIKTINGGSKFELGLKTGS